MRIAILCTAFVAAVSAAGALHAQTADSVALLSASRIAALPAAERQAWERYVDTSRRQMAINAAFFLPDHIRSLASADRARADQRLLRELDAVFLAQFPNGCWPLAYPLMGGVADAVVFRDDTTVNVLRLLRDVARGDFAFGDGRRRRARESLARGVRCVLDSQVVVDGRRTGWSTAHDPLTLAPIGVGGDPGLGAAATAGVLGFLMELDSGDPRVAASVHGGAAWMRETMLWGLAYTSGEEPVPTPGAGPLWARDYETGWNRPLFLIAGAAARNAWREVPASAWTHPGWFTDAPARVLAQYDARVRDRASAPLPPAPARPSVVVDARHGGVDGEKAAGVPTYRTIGAAVAAAPADGREAFVIAVRDGRYYEKLSVQKPNVHLIGESRDGTLLTYDVAAGHRSPGGWQYGTRGSWTLHVAAPGFRLERMTVENGFDFMANAARAEGDPRKITGTQAVAVMLDSGSDRAVFRDCRLAGHQDTLFPNGGRAYFQRCEVLGSVDFIFGAGRAVFDACDIISRDRGSATNNGYVTAPSTPISQPYGFLFVGSRLRKETPGMARNSVTLGRPWHPSGRPDAIGSAVFIDTWMDDHIGATGWSPMNSTDAAGHRVENRPEDARFYEHGSTGPGAVTSPSRRVLTPEQAAEYSIVRVLDGWDPGQ